jgi:hypothetical protein
MRSEMFVCGLVFIMVVVAMLGGGCSAKYDNTDVEVEAKVLSVNENILRGEMIGEFLTSASGSIVNDVNVVGISYSIGNQLFIHDIEVSHAMLAYYSGKNIIPIKVCFESWRNKRYRLVVRVQGYYVSKEYYTREDMDSMLDQEFINKNYKGKN